MQTHWGRRMLIGLTWLLASALAPLPSPTPVAPGIWLIPGGIRPARQPDGNSVIVETPQGLIVVDTCRHDWQRAAILDFAKAHDKPIVAIVNSHWHLDHVSGNPALRAAFPRLKVYASDAIDGALSGFLADSAKSAPAYLDDASLPADTRTDIANDLATIRNGAALRPDIVVAKSGARTIAGRSLEINLARDAATAGDVWLYDPQSRVAITGDLITLPAPFLDTACPDGWREALTAIAATPFTIAIPGHGAPMSRRDVDLYRSAFNAFIDCAGGTGDKQQCADSWAKAISPLVQDDPTVLRRARGMAAYYVDMLRANGGRSKTCATPGPAVR